LECLSASTVARLDGAAGAVVWDGRRDLPDRLWAQTGPIVAARASVVIAQTGAMLAEAGSIAGSYDLPIATAAHAGNGIVSIYLPADRPADDAASRSVEHDLEVGPRPREVASKVATALSEIRERATRLGGHLVIWDAPDEVKTRVPVWGPERPEARLVRALKARFDPVGILNPGRFVGGV
jgi:FAD/FMN-containing dehydrogenase